MHTKPKEFKCTTSSEAFTYNDIWKLEQSESEGPCSQVLCTQQVNASLSIGPYLDHLGHLHSLEGELPDVLNATELEAAFRVTIGNESITLDRDHNLSIDGKTFRIKLPTRHRDSHHIKSSAQHRDSHFLQVFNIQNRAKICIKGAKYEHEFRKGISGPSSTHRTTVLPAPASASSISPSTSAQSRVPSSQIAIAVIIPILTIICLLFVTLYLRKRWRRQPAPGGGMKLDDSDREATTINTIHRYDSPSQPPPTRLNSGHRRPRYFASFTLSSVSTIPQPPPSVNPPSSASSRASVLDRTIGRLKTVRRGEEPRVSNPPRRNTRRGVLRAVNISNSSDE